MTYALDQAVANFIAALDAHTKATGRVIEVAQDMLAKDKQMAEKTAAIATELRRGIDRLQTKLDNLPQKPEGCSAPDPGVPV